MLVIGVENYINNSRSGWTEPTERLYKTKQNDFFFYQNLCHYFDLRDMEIFGGLENLKFKHS